MSEQDAAELKYLKEELNAISSTPKNIEVYAIKTREEYSKAFADKGMVLTSKRDLPRSGQGYRALQRLIQFSHIVKEGTLTTKVDSFVFQPMTINKEQKYAVYYSGSYIALDNFDSEIAVPFSSGYWFKPKMLFVPYDIGNPFDPKTGERRGRWQPAGYTYIHDIFVDAEPKTRRKQIEKLIADKPLDVSNTVFKYRLQNPLNDHSSHRGQISFNNLCDLTVSQLEELQTKLYFKDSSGNLTDKDGYRVRYNNEKIEAIK